MHPRNMFFFFIAFFPSLVHYLWPFRFILQPLCRVPTSGWNHWTTVSVEEAVSGEHRTQTKFHSPPVACFMADTLTCHSRKSAGVINNINNDCTAFRCAKSTSLGIMNSDSLTYLTGVLKQNEAIINPISYTCAFLATTCQNVSWNKRTIN